MASVSVFACDYDIPPAPGGGGGGNSGACEFKSCPVCADGQVCDPSFGCVECRANADCVDESKPLCDLGRCVECTVDDLDRCGSGDTCVYDQCRGRCSQQGNCEQAEDCVLQRCVRCVDDVSCGQGRVCDADYGDCRDCAADSDCIAKDDGTRRCTASGDCVACLVSEDCPQPGRCGADHTCTAACCANSDCVANSDKPSCDQVANACTACTPGLGCARGQCSTTTGHCVECQSDSDCAGDLPACVGQICMQCNDTFMCPDPAVCTNGTCVTPN